MKKILLTLLLALFGFSSKMAFAQGMENQKFERILPVLGVYLLIGIAFVWIANRAWAKKNPPKDFSVSDVDAVKHFLYIMKNQKDPHYTYKINDECIWKGDLSTPKGEPMTMNDGEPYWFTKEPFFRCLTQRNDNANVLLWVRIKDGLHSFINANKKIDFVKLDEQPGELQNINWVEKEQVLFPKPEMEAPSAFGILPDLG